MENNLEILNNIMKPYFDKKQEIENAPFIIENEKKEIEEKTENLRDSRLSRKKELEIELENLRVKSKIEIENFKEKKAQEIDEYISKSMDTNSNFFASYGSMLRRDLEKEYDKKLIQLEKDFKEQEENIISEISKLKFVSEDEKQEKQNLDNLNKKSDFRRVDLRELVEIKDNLRKQLFSEQKRLNSKLLELKPEQELYKETFANLQHSQSKYNEIMNKLQNFKYEYNDQNQLINSNEWKNLFDELNILAEEKNKLTMLLSEKNETMQMIDNINKSLEKLEGYLNLTKLTEEETKTMMMSMTPWEKAEYDRRKAVIEQQDNKVEKEENTNMDEDIDLDKLEEKIIEKAKNNTKSETLVVNLNNMNDKEDVFEFEPINITDLNVDDDEIVEMFGPIESNNKETDKNQENLDEVSDSLITKYNDIVEINDPIESNSEEIDGNIVVDKFSDLLKTIYNDVIKEAKNLATIKINESKGKLGRNQYYVSTKDDAEDYKVSGIVDLSGEIDEDSLQLPCGEYINEQDINKAIDELYNKNKGKTYIVNATGKEYIMSESKVKKFKRKLKQCSAIRHSYSNRISISRLWSKEAKKDYSEYPIGHFEKIRIPDGDYINRNELILTMKNLFTTNKLEWLKKISNALKTEEVTHFYEKDENVIEEDIKKR